jgi:DNA-binding NtrC family response regulator
MIALRRIRETQLPRILVVSPDLAQRGGLGMQLVADADVRTAEDVVSALALIGREAFSGALVDSRLPPGGANEVLDAFVGAFPHAPAAMLASFDNPDALMRLWRRDDRVAVLFRPCNEGELLTFLFGNPLQATGTG